MQSATFTRLLLLLLLRQLLLLLRQLPMLRLLTLQRLRGRGCAHGQGGQQQRSRQLLQSALRRAVGNLFAWTQVAGHRGGFDASSRQQGPCPHGSKGVLHGLLARTEHR